MNFNYLKMKRISNKIKLTTGGVILILLGIFHAAFWNLFDWNTELTKLNQDNSSLVQMMNICTICYLSLMGIILLLCRSEILYSKTGRLLLLSLSIFFAVRLVLEFVFPGSSLLMAGILLFCVLIFLIPLLERKKI